jgi:ATP-binding cassette subfamily B protein
MNMGMPGEKSMNFRGSAMRFLREMRSERAPMALIVVLAVASVVLAVIGPKLLGDATNIIFDGVIGTQLGSAFPAGTTTDEAVAALRSQGQDTFADVVAGSGAVPGAGIDFDQLWQLLMIVLVVTWIQRKVFPDEKVDLT